MKRLLYALLVHFLLTLPLWSQAVDRLAQTPASDAKRREFERELGLQPNLRDPAESALGLNLDHSGGHLSLLYLPFILTEVRATGVEPLTGARLRADLEPGYGLGLRLGAEADGAGLGLMYLFARHDDAGTRGDNQVHLGIFEYAFVVESAELRPWQVGLGLGFGAGLGRIRFREAYDSQSGSAMLVRLQGGLRYGRLRADLGLGGFAMTSVKAYGGFAFLELAIRY